MLQEIRTIIKEAGAIWHDTDYYESRLEYCYNEEHYQMGLELANIALEHHENNVDLKIMKGNFLALLGNHNYKQVFTIIDEVHMLYPDHLEAWFLKFMVQDNSEDTNKYDMIDTIKTVLRLESDANFLNLDLGNLYQELDRPETALKYYRRVPFENMDPDFVKSYMNALKQLHGSELLHADKETHVGFFKAFTDKFPAEPQSWHLLAVAYHHVRDFSKTFDCLDYVEVLDPDYEDIAFDRAAAHYVIFNYGKALSILQAAFKRSNRDRTVPSYILAGMCCECLESLEQAFQYYKKAYDESPESQGAVLGMIPYLKQKEQYELAYDLLKRCIKDNPNDSRLLHCIATVEAERLDDLDLIDNTFQNAQPYNQDNIDFWLDWARVYTRSKNFGRASKIVIQGLEYLPNNSKLNYFAAIYLIENKKIRASFNYLHDALTLNYEEHREVFDYFEKSWTIQKALAKFINQHKEYYA